MVSLKINIRKTPGLKGFVEKFPDQISQSLEETASYGKGLIMASTGGTGPTRAAWITVSLGQFVKRITNPNTYVKFLETGTGLFGPLHKRITSKSGGPLHWIGLVSNRGGKTSYRSRMGNKKGGFKEAGIFAMSTKGMPAQPMIAPNKEAIKTDLMKRMRRTIRGLWNTAKGGGIL